MDTKALQVLTENRMMERINAAKFPTELSPAEKKMLAAVAIT